MASYGQSIHITFVAWDTINNVGKTGDVPNFTTKWIKDGVSSTPSITASEVDATNAPGVYLQILTATECQCKYGTFAGKSSSAGVSIIPVSIAFDKLPLAIPGELNGLPILDVSHRVKADLEAIDGSSTSGNNAALKLKSLDIRSNDVSIPALNIVGASGASGVNGGYGVKIVGGNGGTGSTVGSDGIYSAGGSGGADRGFGLHLASPHNGQGGLKVEGNYGKSAATFEGDSYSDGMSVTGGYGWAGGINANLKGNVGGIENVRPKKNVGLDNFMFPMFDAATKNPKTGLVVTAERAIDGNPFSPCSGSVAEISKGTYRISFSADDMNGGKIMFRFSATGADEQLVEIITQD